MSQRSSDDLIHELASGVAPVRRVPRLRSALGVALAAAIAGAALRLATSGGVRPDLAAALGGNARFAGLATTLAVGAIGAPLAATAWSTPGRGHIAAFGLELTGMAIGGAVLLGGIAAASHGLPRPPAANDLSCFLGSLALGAAPAAALLVYCLRAAPRRSLAVGALAAFAATACGAFVVHLSCASPDPAHWLWGHACAPLAAVAIAGPAFAALLRRSQAVRGER